MRTTARALLLALMPSLLSATAMAAVVHYARHFLMGWSDHAQLIALVALGASVYFGLLFAFAREALSELFMLITKRKLPGGTLVQAL